MSPSHKRSSFVMVLTSFVLGVFIAGLVVFAYAGFQKLLASYQRKLEESSHSLADLTTQTSEVLKQVNQALEENQQKIQELELLKEKFAKGDSPKSDSLKAPEPKPELVKKEEAPKVVSVKKPAPVVRPAVTANKGPLDEEIEHLTSQGIPEDYGRRSRLIELYKKKAESNPSDAHSLMMVGRLSQQLGDFSQATRYLERALDKGANSREVTARLAQIYSEWKMPEKAEYYRQKLSTSIGN